MQARSNTAETAPAAPPPTPEAVAALREQFIAKMAEITALFDRLHDIMHDMNRKR